MDFKGHWTQVFTKSLNHFYNIFDKRLPNLCLKLRSEWKHTLTKRLILLICSHTSTSSSGLHHSLLQYWASWSFPWFLEVNWLHFHGHPSLQAFWLVGSANVVLLVFHLSNYCSHLLSSLLSHSLCPWDLYFYLKMAHCHFGRFWKREELQSRTKPQSSRRGSVVSKSD